MNFGEIVSLVVRVGFLSDSSISNPIAVMKEKMLQRKEQILYENNFVSNQRYECSCIKAYTKRFLYKTTEAKILFLNQLH